MTFREELVQRDRGRFASKPGGDATGNGGAGALAPASGDAHSQKVPPGIRASERERLLSLMGEDPTPQRERQVLTSESDRLSEKARALLGEVRGEATAAREGQRSRGEERRQAAARKREEEDARRAEKGLPARDRAARKLRKKKTRGGGSGSRSRPRKAAGPGPRTELREVFFRLVVVRDMARARGVEL